MNGKVTDTRQKCFMTVEYFENKWGPFGIPTISQDPKYEIAVP